LEKSSRKERWKRALEKTFGKELWKRALEKSFSKWRLFSFLVFLAFKSPFFLGAPPDLAGGLFI
jgi:hypothetical protein